MPRDTNGNTQPLPGTIVSTGDTILPSQHNPMVNDVYAMLTQSLSRDGQGGMRAPLDMSNYRIINLGVATSPNDAVPLSQFQTGSPIGTVVDFAGSSAPSTWLLCYGQAISRTIYSQLFSIIGTVYGAGDGSTTFNVPDLRGRVAAGKDDMGGSGAGRLSIGSLGGSGGSQAHTLSEGEMPSHQHGGTTSTNGSHTHPVPVGTSDNSNQFITARSGVITSSVSSGASGDHSHTLLTDTKGGGLPHNNMQPTIILNKIIKVTY